MHWLMPCLLFISLSLHAFDDLPLEDIPRPGGPDEIRRVIDQAIKEHHERWRKIQAKREKWFEEKAIGGHKLEVLPEGRELLRKRLEAINNATRSVFLSTFIFEANVSARQIGYALCAASKRGVDVRILTDAFGGKRFYDAYAEYLRHNCRLGIMEFNPLNWGLHKAHYVIHEKLLIADGTTVLMGGNGIGDEYHNLPGAKKYYQDLDIEIKGPAACFYHKEFVKTWKKSRKLHKRARYDVFSSSPTSPEYIDFLYGMEELAGCRPTSFGDEKVLPVYNNPFFEKKKRPILDRYLDAFLVSKKEIRLNAPYFVPHDRYIAMLLYAMKKGVKVTLLTNSIESNDESSTLYGMLLKINKLLEAGIDIRLYKGPWTFHRKGGNFDNRWAYFGSDNLDNRGQEFQSESVAFTDSQNAINTFNDEFEKDLANSTKLTPEYMKKIRDVLSGTRRWVIKHILLNQL